MKELRFNQKIIMISIGLLLIALGQYIFPLFIKGNSLDVVSNVSFWLGVLICGFCLFRK